MSLSDLQEKIENRSARVAIIGLGYVGLPLACEFARKGFQVLGIEVRPDRVDQINLAISPFDGKEPGLAELLSEVVTTGRLRASTDYQTLSSQEIILICVETPVDQNNFPQYEALRGALTSLGPVMSPGTLVIIESTVAPRTLETVVLPLLEKTSGLKVNQDFYLGNCPERVMPGRLLKNLRTVSRVVGGMTPETAEVMVSLYRCVVDADLDPTNCITAELVKTAENAYRDVQIAFANEVALICEEVGGDVWKVRELVNKSPFRNMHLPGPGVGGHCIPKDPWLLVHGISDKNTPIRLIPAARAVNDTMPVHMADLVESTLLEAGCELNQASILILGYAYLEDSDDTRNSPSQALIDQLETRGIKSMIHDPYVAGYEGDLDQLAGKCDAAVVMVRHQAYLNFNLDRLMKSLRHPIVIDGRRVFDHSFTVGNGIYKSIGVGSRS